jgi:PPOX class probable F420-dependent enzyme
MTAPASFSAFGNAKYLALETFRKSGVGVKTPVWFAADPKTDLSSSEARLYAYTIGESGKVKRIRNNPTGKIAPCDIRGNVTGEWVAARVEIISGQEAAYGNSLLNKKYFPWKQLLNFFASFSGRGRVGFVIRPA